MPETLPYARPDLKRKRRFPPDVLLGISVGSITTVANVLLLRSFVQDFFHEPRALMWYACAAAEALLSATSGMLLVAGATAVAMNSPRCMALHRAYAASKLILTC